VVRTPRLLTERAKDLRQDQTRAEAHLWQALRATRLGGWKWKRQVPLGPFILDVLSVDAGLAIEVDGGLHLEQVDYDARRTAHLEGQGLRVLRFWNADVLTNRDGVCLAILEACDGERDG
jgi:very-short-patch-repair endonuclease